MLRTLQLILNISRPRFWLYLGGTYLLGYVIGIESINDIQLQFFYFLVFFLFPANIFLYGVNDFFDEETDKINPKKSSHEHLLQPQERNILLRSIIISLGFAMIGFVLLNKFIELILLGSFLLLSFFYSAPPLRFKAKPFLDFSSNFLYTIPGILGFIMASGNIPEILPIIGAFFWTSAMHLFSAVPDIIPDKKAGITTTAVLLGKNYSLFLCFLMWSAFISIILYYGFLLPFSLIAFVYPLIPLILIRWGEVKKVYWYFPYLNGTLGALTIILTLTAKTFI